MSSLVKFNANILALNLLYQVCPLCLSPDIERSIWTANSLLIFLVWVAALCNRVTLGRLQFSCVCSTLVWLRTIGPSSVMCAFKSPVGMICFTPDWRSGIMLPVFSLNMEL